MLYKGKKKEQNTINTEEFSEIQGNVLNSEIPRHILIRVVKVVRADKPAAISKICDGPVTLLLIFTSSDSWNAI